MHAPLPTVRTGFDSPHAQRRRDGTVSAKRLVQSQSVAMPQVRLSPESAPVHRYGPMVRTLDFQPRSPGSVPGSGAGHLCVGVCLCVCACAECECECVWVSVCRGRVRVQRVVTRWCISSTLACRARERGATPRRAGAHACAHVHAYMCVGVTPRPLFADSTFTQWMRRLDSSPGYSGCVRVLTCRTTAVHTCWATRGHSSVAEQRFPTPPTLVRFGLSPRDVRCVVLRGGVV